MELSITFCGQHCNEISLSVSDFISDFISDILSLTYTHCNVHGHLKVYTLACTFLFDIFLFYVILSVIPNVTICP